MVIYRFTYAKVQKSLEISNKLSVFEDFKTITITYGIFYIEISGYALLIIDTEISLLVFYLFQHLCLLLGCKLMRRRSGRRSILNR